MNVWHLWRGASKTKMWQDLITIVGLHLLAASSPGPDTMLLMQKSLTQGRRAGIWLSLGIALGLLVHISYSIAGLGVLISQTPALLMLVQMVAGAYLLYIGYQSFKSSMQTPQKNALEPVAKIQPQSAKKLILMGFWCNVLNPKATLYFLALFSVVISPQLPLGQLIFYGAVMMLVQLLWFSLVAVMLGAKAVQNKIATASLWIERGFGVIIAIFGGKLLQEGAKSAYHLWQSI